jgi:glyoxylase-like metal-dependent hydrolase (beta-lactamase superfamily II)
LIGIAPFLQEEERLLYELVWIEDGFCCASYLGNSWPTSSNIYMAADSDGLTLFDAGIDSPECLAGLSCCLGKIGRAIEDIHTVVLTHGHPDHVGGSNAISRRANSRILLSADSLPEAVDPNRQDYFCLPPQTRAIAPRMSQFDILENFRRTCGAWELDAARLTVIHDGEKIQAGRRTFQAIQTPGHDVGLLCFYETDSKVLLTGDLLKSSGAGSALPWYTSTAGGVEAYLHSLERISSLHVQAAFPAHGALDGPFDEIVKETKDLILNREAAILTMLQAGPKTCEQLDAQLYRPIVLQLCPWFSTVTEAHLSKLEQDGLVLRKGLDYVLA